MKEGKSMDNWHRGRTLKKYATSVGEFSKAFWKRIFRI